MCVCQHQLRFKHNMESWRQVWRQILVTLPYGIVRRECASSRPAWLGIQFRGNVFAYHVLSPTRQNFFGAGQGKPHQKLCTQKLERVWESLRQTPSRIWSLWDNPRAVKKKNNSYLTDDLLCLWVCAGIRRSSQQLSNISHSWEIGSVWGNTNWFLQHSLQVTFAR